MVRCSDWVLLNVPWGTWPILKPALTAGASHSLCPPVRAAVVVWRDLVDLLLYPLTTLTAEQSARSAEGAPACVPRQPRFGEALPERVLNDMSPIVWWHGAPGSSP